MKIRTDFVTNSSSSSFVAMNVKTKLLDTYLEENDLSDLFEKLDGLFETLSENGEMLQAELDKSFSLSLISILKAIVEELDFGDIDEEKCGLSIEALQNLAKFIKKNKSSIDAEAEGNIEIKYSCGEDGYAYVQTLEYKDHHGKMVKWPCADGWNLEEGGGYSQIQKFNMKLFNGEIEELAKLAYTPIYEIAWDDNALAAAIEKTGIVKEFTVRQPSGKAKQKTGND